MLYTIFFINNQLSQSVFSSSNFEEQLGAALVLGVGGGGHGVEGFGASSGVQGKQ